MPINYPLVGRDAFRTATGVHAAAIIKAEAKGDAWLADRIYSRRPGRHVRAQAGDLASATCRGASNVNYWLRQRKIEPSKELVDAILAKAKAHRSHPHATKRSSPSSSRCPARPAARRSGPDRRKSEPRRSGGSQLRPLRLCGSDRRLQRGIGALLALPSRKS